MTPAQAAELIYQHFKTYVDAEYPLMPYCFDNEVFQEPTPATIAGILSPDPCWARVTMRSIPGGGQQTMGQKGNRKFRRRAVLFVQLFGHVGVGRAALDGVVHDLMTLFEGERIGPAGDPDQQVIFWSGNTAELGADGRWYNVTLEVPLDYYETK